MLELRNVSTHYGKIQALHDVSVEVKEGEIVTLIGANGAGKTTLLMTLCGEPKPSSGSIWFEGEQISSLTTARIMRKDIAVVPEGRRIFARLTVEENLLMGAFFVDKAEQHGLLDQVFTLFPRLHERLQQRAGTMSGGEQQMLAIGRALMSKPRLLLLDEPSLGLAPIVIQQIFDTIEQLRRSSWPTAAMCWRTATWCCKTRAPPCWPTRQCGRPIWAVNPLTSMPYRQGSRWLPYLLWG